MLKKKFLYVKEMLPNLVTRYQQRVENFVLDVNLISLKSFFKILIKEIFLLQTEY
jgi:hypothetical protein